MALFRKKPVMVEALRWEYSDKGIAEMTKFMNGAGMFKFWKRLEIRTPEGLMEAKEGDWIIKGVDGELYPCKPDIFAKTYEAVVS